MTTINLKDFYSWHTHDEYIEVSDEVAAELRADKLYEAAYQRRIIRNKAQSLKMQVEAIKHQGARPGEDAQEAGKRSTQIVGDRNGMNYKQVQRYIRLTELVPDLQC